MSETDCLLIIRALKRNLAIQFTPAPGREAEVAKWPPVLFFEVSPAQLPARQNSFEAKINDKVFVCGLYFLRNRPDDKQPRVGRFRFSKQKCITNAI